MTPSYRHSVWSAVLPICYQFSGLTHDSIFLALKFLQKKKSSYDELMTAIMTKVGSYNVLWNIKTIFGIIVLEPIEASVGWELDSALVFS